MDVMEAILSRRSIRKYKPDAVSDEDLETVLEAARWAPSWANTQCTRFVVVKDRETKAALSATLSRGNPAADAVVNAPVVIVACAKRGESGFYKGSATTDKGDWFMFDVALAMANLTLAAQALGLGTVHVGLFDAQGAARILAVPEEASVVSMTPLGYAAEPSRAPRRRELHDIVFHEKYGQPKA